MAMTTQLTSQKLKVLNQFLGKADAKDKICATIQYVAMFLSAGEAGKFKQIQGSVASARKVFRIAKPWESVTPLVTDYEKQSTIGKLKALFMAIYFGADHIVWASQAKLFDAPKTVERCTKVSLYGWFAGSLCGIVENVMSLKGLLEKRSLPPPEKGASGEDAEAKRQERHATAEAINTKSLAVVHGLLQASLACGLLQLLPFKPRTVGAIGSVTSAMNCYIMMPNMPKALPPPKKVA